MPAPRQTPVSTVSNQQTGVEAHQLTFTPSQLKVLLHVLNSFLLILGKLMQRNQVIAACPLRFDHLKLGRFQKGTQSEFTQVDGLEPQLFAWGQGDGPWILLHQCRANSCILSPTKLLQQQVMLHWCRTAHMIKAPETLYCKSPKGRQCLAGTIS